MGLVTKMVTATRLDAFLAVYRQNCPETRLELTLFEDPYESVGAQFPDSDSDNEEPFKSLFITIDNGHVEMFDFTSGRHDGANLSVVPYDWDASGWLECPYDKFSD